MSAINPASFVVPNPGLQVASGLGQGSACSDRDSHENRVGKENVVFPMDGLSQIPQGSFGQLWTTGVDATIPASIPLGAYPHFYGSQAVDPHQINPNMPEYGRTYLAPGRSQSPFNYQGNSAIRLQSSNYPYTDLKNTAGRSAYVNPDHDWSKNFHGLSLGS